MRKFLLSIMGSVLITPLAYMQGQGGGTVSPEYQDMVEKSVLAWADKTFEYYDGARFEKLEITASKDYERLSAKINGMKEYKVELAQMYQSGELNKTQAEYDAMVKKNDRKIDSMEVLLKDMPVGASGYEIDFWANIMTNNGLTVYYKHHVILSGDFTVTTYKQTSSIGKANDEQKILFKNKK